jgi:hypothetical protein
MLRWAMVELEIGSKQSLWKVFDALFFLWRKLESAKAVVARKPLLVEPRTTFADKKND